MIFFYLKKSRLRKTYVMYLVLSQMGHEIHRLDVIDYDNEESQFISKTGSFQKGN